MHTGDEEANTISNEPKWERPGDLPSSPGASPFNTDDANLVELAEQHRSGVRSPKRIIRACLLASFDYSGIRAFCQDHFEPVFSNLTDADRPEEVVTALISHCKQYDRYEYLWECIRSERPDSAEKYFIRWQEASASTRSSRSDEESGYATRPTHTAKAQSGHEVVSHVLTIGSEDEITSWFYEELSAQERALLLGVALFEGMRREKIHALQSQIADNLFADETK